MPHEPRPAAYVDLAVLGTVVRVHLDDPADREAVQGPWELCVLPDGDRDVPDESVVRLPATPDERSRLNALTTLTQDVTRAGIRAQSGRLLMFHAGALSNLGTGATVAYVAPGGTGKTTITTTLGSGHGYVTDETVGVTLDGAVVPYPKPLSVRRDGGKDEVPPSKLGLQPPRADPWLAGLLVVRRDSDHVGAPVDRAVGLLDAITMLAPETSALAELPAPLRSYRDLIERVGGVRHVVYREAHQLGELVDEFLGRERPWAR